MDKARFATWIIRPLIAITAIANLTFIADHMHKPLVITKTKEVALTNATADHIARELLTPKNYNCLKQIIKAESHGNPKAKNPESTARGIGQLLDTTYRNLGMKHSGDDKAQLVAMLAYIGRRYGSGGPCSALLHEKRHNWF